MKRFKFSAWILFMLMSMIVPQMAWASQQTYISDVYILHGGEYKWSDKDPLPEGYTMIDQDLNEHQGGDYVYLCYKTTTDIREAITDIIVLTGNGDEYNYSGKRNITYRIDDDGREYHAAGYSEHSDGGLLNQGRSIEYNGGIAKSWTCPMWLYYTKQGSADIGVCKPSAITSISLEWSESTKDSYVDSYGGSFYMGAQLSMDESLFGDKWLHINVSRSSDEEHISWTFTPQKKVTCTTDGNIGYWTCNDCGRHFDPEFNGNRPVVEYRMQDIVIPALGHDWNKSYDETTGAWQLDCKRCSHNEVRKQMCITANEDSVSLYMLGESNPSDDDDWYGGPYEFPEVQYALNGGPWKALTEGDFVSMNQGDMVWLKGDNIYFSRDESNYTWFVTYGSVSATGNVTSLIDNTGEGTYNPYDYCFYRLFESSALETSPRLNATKLSEGSYKEMFYGCNKLREVILCATDKASVESAIDGWLTGTDAGGVVHISDELALANANLQLPANWRADKVGIHANQDPDNAGDYYATFYDSMAEYSVPEDTKAYTGIVDGYNLIMTAEEDNIIPAGEGVLLKGNTADVILALSETNKSTTTDNALTGKDTDTTAPDNCYIFTYAQNGLGFYKYDAGKPLAAHNAYLVHDMANNTRGFSMVFDSMDGTPTGIESLLTPSMGDDVIYNLQGVRMNKLQKGINIVNGKKIVLP